MTYMLNPMPTFPDEFIDACLADPAAAADAMSAGMQAMSDHMAGGGDMSSAFDILGDAMQPMFEDMGVSPELFETVGDMVSGAVGSSMHMAPEQADAVDMGAIIQDCCDMMMPNGQDVPPVITDACGHMGGSMHDSGMTAHDCGAEMMGAPGSDGYPLPCDEMGMPLVEAGSYPEDGNTIQLPPEGGHCDACGLMGEYTSDSDGSMDEVLTEAVDQATDQGGEDHSGGYTSDSDGSDGSAEATEVGDHSDANSDDGAHG